MRCVVPAGAVLGEGALWDVAEQALYWVDIKGRRVHRDDPQRDHDQHGPVDEDIGSLAVRAGGGLVLALRSGFHFFDPQTGRTRPAAEPEPERVENRFNDGKTDRQGRFRAGSMHNPETRPTGGLYRLDADLSCRRLIDGIVVSNALCWSPDGRTMYHTDTPTRIVSAWDFIPPAATSPTGGRSCAFLTGRAIPTAPRSTPMASSGSPTGMLARHARRSRRPRGARPQSAGAAPDVSGSRLRVSARRSTLASGRRRGGRPWPISAGA